MYRNQGLQAVERDIFGKAEFRKNLRAFSEGAYLRHLTCHQR